MNLDRGPFYNKGISPRQRRVFILRWNPSISSFSLDDFEDEFAQLQGTKPFDNEHPLDWNVWDWKEVMHRDLFVMMMVGQKHNGIVWGVFFDGYPYQYEDENGNPLKSVFFKTDVMYMHRIGNTNILSAEKLTKAIPEVDWLHGHSGEILSVECAEKLGLLLVDELKNVDSSENIYFDSYNQKKYVLADILTFMCPELKKRLLSLRKIDNKRLRNVHNLMVKIEDEEYEKWTQIEDHLSLTKLNDILMSLNGNIKLQLISFPNKLESSYIYPLELFAQNKFIQLLFNLLKILT